MKSIKYLILSVGTFIYSFAYSQSNDCSTGTMLTVTATCTSPTAGTTAGATQSIPGCSGNADDDVWYKFVATGTSHLITVIPSATFDPVVQLLSGNCVSLSTISCMDIGGSGTTENIYATGLTVGVTYTIRIYHFGAGSGSGTFTICITNPPPAPVNNDCSGAINLSVNSTCTTTAGTSFGGTLSSTGCVGSADDDVWYSFTASNSVQTITVDPSSAMNAVVQLYSGTCGSLTSLYCMDNGLTNVNEVISAVGLNPGSVYFIRVYDKRAMTAGAPFTICITGSATAAPTNDEPCSAIALPNVTSTCNFLHFTTTGATATASAPAPSSCAGGNSPFQGGFTASSHDVWFSITVPASGNIFITPEPGYGISDGVMALYSGACSSLTQVACSDDNVAYPGTANDLKPYLSAGGLTPGTTVFLRYWAFGTGSGNFGLCVSSPTNDLCANALYICDLNGFSASTSAAYTADRPSNMRGNAEVAGTYAFTPGTNTNGIFGSGGAWGTGSPSYNVQINNNSWIKFTASAATAVLGVSISDCWVGNYPSGGIQMQIFSGTNCTNFTPVSDFKENSTGFTITAIGLTVGQTYYLMVDGYANDVCNYTITANSGVLFPAITATVPSICFGSNTTLTAPAGATSYEWSPGGQTTQIVTVSPSTTTTFTCTVEGVCGYKQTLTKTIVVNPLPTVQINSGNPVNVCNTQSVTLTASGATNYSWNTGSTSSSISVSPASNTSYTVTGTDANGCAASSNVMVNVLSLPTITVNSPTICFGQTATVTSAGAGSTSSYSWSNGTSGTNTINVSPTSLTSYTVTGTAVNGCTNTAVSTVTVIALPTITVNSGTICNGQTATLTANGGASSTSYSWSNGTNNINTISVSPGSTATYTVTGTANSCTNTAVATVNVNSLPAITVNSGTICNGQNITLTANGGNTYSWNTGASGPAISVNPNASITYTVTGVDGNSCSNTAIASITVNSVPTLTTAPTITPSSCGLSTGAITGAVASGNGALQYSWTNSSNTIVGSTADLSNQPAGVYNLTVTDGNGCNTVFGPFSITNPGAPAPPTITALDTVVCVGEQIVLNASSGAANPTYNWTGPNASSNTSNLTIASAALTDAGTYAVTVTANNCTSSPFLITIIVNSLPLANATNIGSPYCSDSTITLVASGGTGYAWTGPGGFTSTNQNPSIPNSTTAMTGVYTVTVTDNNGCVASATANVTVNQTPASPIVSANANNYCEGQTILFSSSSAGATSYSWIGPNGFSSSAQNPSIANSVAVQSGTYTVYATSTGCNSANATVNVIVNANPIATASINATTICSGTAINLSSTGGSSYAWTGPGAYTSSQQNPLINNSTVTNSGTYIVTVTNAANCTDTASVSILVNQTPNAPVLTGDTTCVGGTLTLSATGTGTFDWYSDAALTNLVQGNSNSYSPTLPINTSSTYYVTATSNGCTSAVASANAVNYNVIASVFANPTTGLIPLNVQFANTSSGVDSSDTFNWSINNSTFSNSYNSSYTFTNNGNYNVSLIIIDDQSGCTDTATLNILADGDITFEVPNVFTPNNDGENEVFSIISHGLKELNVSIYDRWGLKMCDFDGLKGSWDGRTTSGVQVPDGTYYYLFHAIDINGKEFQQNGHLMIIR